MYCSGGGLTSTGSVVFVMSGGYRALEVLYLQRLRWKHCICNVWGLAGSGSIVFAMSGGSRALKVMSEAHQRFGTPFNQLSQVG